MNDIEIFENLGITTELLFLEVEKNVTLRCIKFSRNATGKPVIFFPGWISPIRTWRHFIPELSTHHTVYYVESREKPSSRVADKGDYSVSKMTMDINEVIRYFSFDEKEYILTGSSMGATTVLEAAYIGFPIQPLCIGLILPNINVGLPRYTPLLRYVPDWALPLLKEIIKTVFIRLKVDPDHAGHKERFIHAINASDSRKLRESALSIWEYQMNLGQLELFKFPSLIIGASNDKAHNQENVQIIADHISRSVYYDLGSFTASHSSQCAKILVAWFSKFENKYGKRIH